MLLCPCCSTAAAAGLAALALGGGKGTPTRAAEEAGADDTKAEAKTA